MRGIGFVEIIALLAFLIFLRTGWLTLRRSMPHTNPTPVGSRQCPHCGQRIPDFGAYCAICGHKIV